MAESDEQQEYREALGGRIHACVASMSTKAAAAEVAGVTVEQLNKWIKGQVKVPVDALRLLAQASRTDFGWLVTGKRSAAADVVGVGQPSEDEIMILLETFEIVHRMVERVYEEEKVVLPKVALFHEIHDRNRLLVSRLLHPFDKSDVELLLPWLENRIRKELLLAKAAPGTGKHSAS
jgi:transcriptional regulator with XRE-family HTH domain